MSEVNSKPKKDCPILAEVETQIIADQTEKHPFFNSPQILRHISYKHHPRLVLAPYRN